MNSVSGIRNKLHQHYDLFIIFILLLTPILIASPLSHRFLPLSDGTAHYFKIWLLRYELDNYGKIFDWNPFWYDGHPLFRFYPPASYWTATVLSYALPFELYQIVNLMVFSSYIILSFSMYYLARTLGLSKISSLVTSVLAVISPVLASSYAFMGVFPTNVALAFVPVALAFFIKSFDENKLRYLLITALLLSFIILVHHLTAYFTAMMFFVTIIVKNLPFNLTKFKQTLKSLLMIAGIVFLITSFWTIPLLLEFEYSNFINRYTVDPFKVLFTSFSKECIELYCFRALGPAFSVVGLIGIFLSFVRFDFVKRRIEFVLERNHILVSLMFLAVLLILFLSFLRFYKFIPFGAGINYERFSLYLILPTALLGGIVIEKIRKNFALLITTLIIMLITFSSYAVISYSRNYDLPVDVSTISYSEQVKQLYDFIKNQDEGRMAVYGTFRPFAYSVLPILTQREMISGWYHESSLIYDTILNKTEEPDLVRGEFLDKISSEEFLKLLDEGFVRYVFINICSEEGSKVNNVLTEKFSVIYDHDNCFKILKNSETYYTIPNLNWEKISPEEIVIHDVPNTTLIVKEAHYPHWHAYCKNDEFPIKSNEFGMMSIDAKNCQELYLKYEYPIFYNSFYFVSLLTLLAVMIRIFIKRDTSL